jgi:hypothetical protein
MAKNITIALSERSPVSIDPEKWPVIAAAKAWDNRYEFQANHIWKIVVRQHGDGRRIAYCSYDSGNGGAPEGFRAVRGGYLLDQPDLGPAVMAESTIRAIRRCAGIIDRDDLGAECIGDLPAEVLS